VVIYLTTANLQGVSSRKLARDLGIMQKSVWHMTHRIRKALEQDNPELLGGIVEIDEIFVGGKELNQHKRQKRHKSRGIVSQTAKVGAVQSNS